MKVKYIATINLEIEQEMNETDLREDANIYMNNRISRIIKDEMDDEVTTNLLKIESRLILNGKEVKE